MAISRGFPPSNTISPTVKIAEKDLSFIQPSQSFHRAGIVGFASKGPINIPTLIGTNRQLHTIFGNPHPESGDPYMIYASEQYLTVANELIVVRVADEDPVSDEAAKIASLDIPSAGGQILITGSVAENFSFSEDLFFRWRLNGVLASKTLVVLADDNRPAPFTGDPYTCAQLAEDLNLQLVPAIDGIQFFCTTSNRLGIRTTFAYGPDSELELVSIQNSLYGSNSVVGLGTGMTEAATTGSLDRYPNDGYHVSGEWDFSGLTDLNLQIVLDGTDNTLVDNVVQVVDLGVLEGGVHTTQEVVDVINDAILNADVPGGFLALATGDNLTIKTLHQGRDARLLVKSESTAFGIFGFDGLTASGDSPQGVSGDVAVATYGVINGSSNTAGDVTFTLKADSAGIDGSNTSVVITNNIRDGIFNIEVFNNGIPVEAWGNLSKDQSNRYYVETFLSLASDFIRASDNTDNPAPPLNGTYTLLGGSDGIPADPDEQDDLLIGNSVGFTGLYALSEPEQIDIDLIAVPGHPSSAVIEAMLDLCSNLRQDCIALIDPPFGLSVKEIIQWQNGVHPLNNVRFDSDFGALYWPWVKLRDTFNQIDVWCPPSGSIMAVYAISDSLSAPWFAPAGLTRGLVPNILDVFSRPTLEERDLMYGNSNCINPIVQFPGQNGFVVWGQKTLQRRPSALDRVNVRRLMFYIEKNIKVQCRQLLFEPHDQVFTNRFINICKSVLTGVQVGRGINDFIIDAGDELNTEDVIDRNEFRARIGIQPIKAVEFIFIEFSIHRTGDFTSTSNTF